MSTVVSWTTVGWVMVGPEVGWGDVLVENVDGRREPGGTGQRHGGIKERVAAGEATRSSLFYGHNFNIRNIQRSTPVRGFGSIG